MSVREVVLSTDDFNQIISKRFTLEWNGTVRNVPLSEVIKRHRTPYNTKDGFQLPPKDSSDNLTLSDIAIVQAIDYLNDHIEIINRDFRSLSNIIAEQQTNPLVDLSTAMQKVRINSEILAYLLKTIIDKIIVMLAYAYNEVGIDSIGNLLSNKRVQTFCNGILVKHEQFLDEINGLHNAYKHTFSNLQLVNIVPTIEPVMFAIYKINNSTKKPTRIYHMICSNAVDEFNAFMKTVKNHTTTKARR